MDFCPGIFGQDNLVDPQRMEADHWKARPPPVYLDFLRLVRVGKKYQRLSFPLGKDNPSILFDLFKRQARSNSPGHFCHVGHD